MRRQWKTQADFTYSILGNVISIIDPDLGNRSVTNDIENVLRKIEYYHQGSIAAFHTMYGVTTRKCQNCPVRENPNWTI
jgi:hypothetical protein